MPIAFGTGMSRLSFVAGFLGTMITASACSYLPPVALEATPADLKVLAGEWVGEYESVALARRGSMEFRLAAGTDAAYGAVLMVPRGPAAAYRAEGDDTAPARSPDPFSSEQLTIRFIRASHGSITGRLDRYWDPDRQCYATTVFRGVTGRGVVEGTFRTTFECGAGEATGNWRMTKKPARR